MDEAVPAARRILGPNVSASLVLRWAADTSRLRGDLEAARRYLAEAQRIAERSNDRAGQVGSIRQEALIARDAGDLEQARELLVDQARRVDLEQLKDFPLWPTHAAQASVELRAGDPGRALEYLRVVLAEPDRLPHLWIVEAIDMTAVALIKQGRAKDAARVIGAVDHEREQSGLAIQPPDKPIRETAIHQAQSSLGEGWEAEVGQGRAMTLDEAVAHAVEHLGPLPEGDDDG